MMSVFKNKELKAVLPIILWGVYLIFQLSSMMNRFETGWAVLRALLFVCVHILLFYIHLHILIPRFFEKKQYLIYSALLFAMVLASASFVSRIDVAFFREHALIFNHRNLPLHFKPGQIPQHMPGHPRGVGMRFGMLLFWIESVLMFFLSFLYYSSQKSNEREKEKTELQNKVLEAESRFLKSQINPHFLFNALNNIYSLSLMESKQTPEAIFKLSSMLRYVLYDSRSEYVSLTDEVKYIEDYIDLQRLKDEDDSNIDFKYSLGDSSAKLAPMIFIPFVENAFKHSNVDDKENGRIAISIESKPGEIVFVCENTLPVSETPKDQLGGVGLGNVQKRLQLIYKTRFDLEMEKREKVFYVKLLLRS